MRSERVGAGIFEHWTPEEVSAAIERGEIHLIDVREPQEYMIEKIAGAAFLPMSSFTPEDLPADDKPVVLYCATGNRTRRAATMVLGEGAEKIAHMEGGITAWKRAGLPTD